jgi:hypothetical protein
MLVACRLAGLSALETHCAGVRACAQCGPRLSVVAPARLNLRPPRQRRIGGMWSETADPRPKILGPIGRGGASHDAGRSRVSVRRSVEAVSGFVIRQRPRVGS